MNQLYRFFLIVCMAFVAAACNRDAESDPQPERLTAVTIDCGGSFGVDVRTFIEGPVESDQGKALEIGWDEGDRFRLWSCKSDGTFVTSGVNFALYHYDMTFPVARFKGEVDLKAYDAGSTYNYYAVSPVPASEDDVQGTQVSYTLPAVQTGDFDGSLDILTAQLLDAPALAGGHNPDIRLQFKHQVHVLQISIPQSRLGEDIRAIELTFPAPVVGKLTVDATGASDPVLTEGSNVVTLKFAEPKKVGDVIYVTIAPTTIPADGVISMRIMGRTGETSTDCLRDVEREMAAGHFSPIELRVPAMNVHYAILKFSLPADLGASTLGEAVNKVTITLPNDASLEGAVLPDNVVLEGRELTYDVKSVNDRNCLITLPSDVEDDIIGGLNGKAVTAVFESARALNLTSTIAGKTLIPNDENIYEYGDFRVPYLFEEDFSDMTESAEWNSNHGTANAGSKDGHQFHGLWSGARCGVSAGKSIRLACRREWFENYPARVDSAPLSCIRPGATGVSVEFSFNWSMNQDKGGIGTTNVGQTCYFGFVNDEPYKIRKSDENDFTHKESFFIDKNTSGGSYDNIPTDEAHTKTISLDGCLSTSRLSWRTENESSSKTSNNTVWLYIDNVKVKLK